MKIQLLAATAAAALTLLGSGCLVTCHFEKHIDVNIGKGSGELTSICHGKIVVCNLGDYDCKNVLKVECDDVPVYRGPYTVTIQNNTIKYTASNWSGPDDPFIKTQLPQHDHDVVWAFERDDDSSAKGSCRYDFGTD